MDPVMDAPFPLPQCSDSLRLEQALRGAEGLAVLAAYDRQLLSLEQRLQTALAKGLPPPVYDRGTLLQEGVIVARKLLRLVRQLPPTT